MGGSTYDRETVLAVPASRWRLPVHSLARLGRGRVSFYLEASSCH